MANKYLLFFYALGPALLGATGLVFLKQVTSRVETLGLNNLVQWFFQTFTSLDFLIGSSLYVFAFVWLIIVMPYVKISQFFPLAVGLNIIFTSLAGWLFLNESIPLLRIVGIVFIIMGVLLVSR